MFWIIDGDAELKDDFNFDYVTTQTDTVHVWRSENPVMILFTDMAVLN